MSALALLWCFAMGGLVGAALSECAAKRRRRRRLLPYVACWRCDGTGIERTKDGPLHAEPPERLP